MPYLSDKDRDDILFGIEAGFDFIAASFTRCAPRTSCEIRGDSGGATAATPSRSSPRLRTPRASNNIDEILRVSDGIMVARGDMGVEIPLEDVPIIQKMIIQNASTTAGKHVITATQMLDSMMQPSPPHPSGGHRRGQRYL